ncbi:cytidylyltransferase domain-containing protein [Mucilaginibacter sp. SP1R1]|uniref:cytidylyltransferase domain-containing protein n=1 Tax=Mucilaginibacter sp. SP1R1 TaxID=2723091 RepID=UPI001618C50A|nr:glycosyltransferase family protein [Mucilaginibacter sp. SP1R1]MBB6149832.1 spore coat polysaccharide biosynthesis protein SpsF [Mucilaginibacter sp. SP1R1]
MANKVVIIVQARMASSRLPGKVMLQILGKSILALMIERLQMIKHIAAIVIATSADATDDVIAQEAQLLGIPCYRGDQHNLLDRHYQAALLFNADTVLKIPSDCPLIDPRIIDHVLTHFFARPGWYDYMSNLHPATYPDGNDVEIMTMACLKRTWENAQKLLELEHTTPYIWENPQLFSIGNVSWETGGDYSMSHRFTIDYQEDYEFIKTVFEELYPGNKNFSCFDIISLLYRQPNIYQINAQYAGVNWYRHHLTELKTIQPGQTKQAPENLINS